MDMTSGGSEKSATFYKNPQFILAVDRKKVPNWEAVSKLPFYGNFSYECNNGTPIKMLLCNTKPGNLRIISVNDGKTLIDR